MSTRLLVDLAQPGFRWQVDVSMLAAVSQGTDCDRGLQQYPVHLQIMAEQWAMKACCQYGSPLAQATVTRGMRLLHLLVVFPPADAARQYEAVWYNACRPTHMHNRTI